MQVCSGGHAVHGHVIRRWRRASGYRGPGIVGAPRGIGLFGHHIWKWDEAWHEGILLTLPRQSQSDHLTMYMDA